MKCPCPSPALAAGCQSLQELLEVRTSQDHLPRCPCRQTMMWGIGRAHRRSPCAGSVLPGMASGELVSLVASPPAPRIWLQLHSCYRNFAVWVLRIRLPAGTSYCPTLRLDDAVTAQPACSLPANLSSFRATSTVPPKRSISDRGSPAGEAIFWIDPTKDLAQALRPGGPPPPESEIYYFTCDTAQSAADHLAALRRGATISELGPPAGTSAGQGVLRNACAPFGATRPRQVLTTPPVVPRRSLQRPGPPVAIASPPRTAADDQRVDGHQREPPMATP